MENQNVYSTPKAELIDSNRNDIILASRWARLGGALIDTIILLLVVGPILFLTGFWETAMTGEIPFSDTVIYGLLGMVVYWVLHGYLLLNYGQTIGKRALGIKIVSVENNEILPLSKIFLLRYLPIAIISNLPATGQILATLDILFIFGKNKRCIHDLIAGSRVIKDN